MWRTERLDNLASRTVVAVNGTPEFNVATFAFLFNFAWEILQASQYASMASMPHAQVPQTCLQATVDDMVIMLLAYGAIATVARSRSWIVVASGSAS